MGRGEAERRYRRTPEGRRLTDVVRHIFAAACGSRSAGFLEWPVAKTLLLAFRTPEGRTPVLGEAANDAAAAFGLALFAFTVVDLKRVLKIAEFAGGLTMIPKR